VRRSVTALAGVVGTALLLAATSAGRATGVRWSRLAQVIGAVDVAGPRADGRFVVASHQGLFLLRRNGTSLPFARAAGGYVAPQGEPYIALAAARAVPGSGCSFRRDDVYAVDPTSSPGVSLIERSGHARRFFDLPAGSFPSGIAFDSVGRFGHRLLVTVIVSGQTTLYAIDCRGRARVVLQRAPRVEGAIAVAPSGFGSFGGRLIAADEVSGRIYAFDARGRTRVLVQPKLPIGGDIGVESLGFVPAGFSRRGVAYLADLGAPGSPTQGTDSVLRLGGRALRRAGVRSSDLLVATEARGVTIDLRCALRCTVRRIGRALDATHAEGHIALAAH
jgi:hypothetical protein